MTDSAIRDAPEPVRGDHPGRIRRGERIVLWIATSVCRLRPREIAPEVLGSARLVHVDDEDQDAATTAARIRRPRACRSRATSIV